MQGRKTRWPDPHRATSKAQRAMGPEREGRPKGPNTAKQGATHDGTYGPDKETTDNKTSAIPCSSNRYLPWSGWACFRNRVLQRIANAANQIRKVAALRSTMGSQEWMENKSNIHRQTRKISNIVLAKMVSWNSKSPISDPNTINGNYRGGSVEACNQ
jgi:hypothetical protein